MRLCCRAHLNPRHEGLLEEDAVEDGDREGEHDEHEEGQAPPIQARHQLLQRAAHVAVVCRVHRELQDQALEPRRDGPCRQNAGSVKDVVC